MLLGSPQAIQRITDLEKQLRDTRAAADAAHQALRKEILHEIRGQGAQELEATVQRLLAAHIDQQARAVLQVSDDIACAQPVSP